MMCCAQKKINNKKKTTKITEGRKARNKNYFYFLTRFFLQMMRKSTFK